MMRLPTRGPTHAQKDIAPRLLPLLLLLVLALGACGPATPSPTPVPPTSPVNPTLGAVPTAKPGEYPPLPTVTPYVAAAPGPGVYSRPDYGVTLHYPEAWQATEGDPSSGNLVVVRSPGNDLLAGLFVAPPTPNLGLQELSTEVLQGFAQSLSDVAILSDEATQLGDGRQAWMVTVSGTESGNAIKFSLVTALSSGQEYVLIVYGVAGSYDASSAVISDLIGSLRLEPPALPYGLARSETLVLSGGESTNPREYDPATTHGSGNKMVFSGLVSFDTNLNLVPELAESWQVADGTVYTFTLRENARFHNGRPVTAADVVYSWERAADPKTESDTVLTYLGDIVGVKEMNAGQAEHIAGLKVVDERTLQVTIDAPKPYFLLKLTYPTAFVLDRANVESGSEWYRTPNGTGPYRLTRWETFTSQLYERNDDFYLDPPAIRYVLVKIYQGIALRLYESGEIDVAGVVGADIQRMLDPKEALHADLHSAVSLCTGYMTLDVTKPPFDDPKVRQAFSMAFNRQQYISVVFHGLGLPAVGLFPPGLPGYNAGLKGLPYDPERARQLLAESSYGGPQGLPPIVYTDGGYGSDVNPDVAAVAQMWEQTLGVTITVENLEPDRYLDEIYAGHHGQIFSVGWCADYPDPENFADVLFHTGSPQNRGNYSNPQVDALLEQARVEQDVAKRISLYQQAEQLIVDDAPVIFTFHNVSYMLVRPYIQGYTLTPIDIPLERYLWIDPSKLP